MSVQTTAPHPVSLLRTTRFVYVLVTDVEIRSVPVEPPRRPRDPFSPPTPAVTVPLPAPAAVIIVRRLLLLDVHVLHVVRLLAVPLLLLLSVVAVPLPGVVVVVRGGRGVGSVPSVAVARWRGGAAVREAGHEEHEEEDGR